MNAAQTASQQIGDPARLNPFETKPPTQPLTPRSTTEFSKP